MYLLDLCFQVKVKHVIIDGIKGTKHEKPDVLSKVYGRIFEATNFHEVIKYICMLVQLTYKQTYSCAGNYWKVSCYWNCPFQFYKSCDEARDLIAKLRLYKDVDIEIDTNKTGTAKVGKIKSLNKGFNSNFQRLQINIPIYSNRFILADSDAYDVKVTVDKYSKIPKSHIKYEIDETATADLVMYLLEIPEFGTLSVLVLVIM